MGSSSSKSFWQERSEEVCARAVLVGESLPETQTEFSQLPVVLIAEPPGDSGPWGSLVLGQQGQQDLPGQSLGGHLRGPGQVLEPLSGGGPLEGLWALLSLHFPHLCKEKKDLTLPPPRLLRIMSADVAL